MNLLKVIFVLLSLLAFATSLRNSEKSATLRDAVQIYKNINALYKNMTSVYKENAKMRIQALRVCRRNVTELAAQNREFKLVKSNLEQAQNVIELLYSKEACTNKTLLETQTNYNNSLVTIGKLEFDLKRITEKVRNKDIEINKNNNLIFSMNKTINDLSTARDQLMAKSNNDSKQLEENSKTIETLHLNVTQSSASIDQMSQRIQQLTAELQANKNRIEKLTSLISAYESECNVGSCELFGNSTDVHLITVKGMEERIRVRCDGKLYGAGWTVIQSRDNGAVDFYRNWSDYKHGFGNAENEYFMGLEKLHHMTAVEPHVLYIHLEDFEGGTRYAKYDHFVVGSEAQSYAIKQLGEFEGNVEDLLEPGHMFSTFDRDNDSEESINCAQTLHGGWWYADCGFV